MASANSYISNGAQRKRTGYSTANLGYVEAGLTTDDVTQIIDTHLQDVLEVINVTNGTTTVQVGGPSTTTVVIGGGSGDTEDPANTTPVPNTTTTVISEKTVIKSTDFSVGQYINLNSQYNSITSSEGGLIINVQRLTYPTFTVTAGTQINGTTLTLNQETGLVPALYVQLIGSLSNDGLYQVQTHTDYTLTINTIANPEYVSTTFVTETAPADVQIVPVRVTLIRGVSDTTWPVEIGTSALGNVSAKQVVYNTSAPNFTSLELTDATDQLKMKNTIISAAGATNATHTIPNTSSDEFTLCDADQTLKNKDIEDASCNIVDNTDSTRYLAFSIAGTPNTSTLILTNQTATRNVSLPDATTRLIGYDTVDTLTNKTIQDPATNNVAASGLATSANTIIDTKSVAPSIGQILRCSAPGMAAWETPFSLSPGKNVTMVTAGGSGNVSATINVQMLDDGFDNEPTNPDTLPSGPSFPGLGSPGGSLPGIGSLPVAIPVVLTAIGGLVAATGGLFGISGHGYHSDGTAVTILDSNGLTTKGQISGPTLNVNTINELTPGNGITINNNTTINGDLDVNGTITAQNFNVTGSTSFFDVDDMLIKDRFIHLNAGGSGVMNTGGLVVQVDRLSSPVNLTGNFTAGVDTVSNPYVSTDVASGIAANSFIYLDNSTSNNGLYEVLSHSSNILTIRGVGLHDTYTVSDQIARRDFDVESAVGASVYACSLTILRCGQGTALEICTAGQADTLTYLPILNTTNGAVVSNKSLVDATTNIVNSTDASKKMAFSAAGNSAGCTLTLNSAVTSNRTLNFPDLNDTLVSRTNTESLTNKTLGSGTQVGANISFTGHNLYNIGTNTVRPATIYTTNLDSRYTMVIGQDAVRANSTRLAIHGEDNNTILERAAIDMYTSDQYPIVSLRAGAHDTATLSFDAYQSTDGFWRSSDAGSNYLIQKFSDLLQVFTARDVAQGAEISSSWRNALTLTNTSLWNVEKQVDMSAADYSVGTASQSGFIVTGSGTSWVSAHAGGLIFFANGSYATIIRVVSATQLTVSVSQSVTSQAYTIKYGAYHAARNLGTPVLHLPDTGSIQYHKPNGTLYLECSTLSGDRTYNLPDTQAGYIDSIAVQQQHTINLNSSGLIVRNYSCYVTKHNNLVTVTIKDMSGAQSTTTGTNNLILTGVLPAGFRPSSTHYSATGLVFWNLQALTWGWSVDTSGNIYGWYISGGAWIHGGSGNDFRLGTSTLSFVMS